MDNRDSVFKTLLYFDIFNYPLTKEELLQFLPEKISKKDLSDNLKQFKNIYYKSFYYLKKESVVNERIKREKISLIKLKKAKNVIKKLSLIPTVDFIGISGSLSMKNSKLEDDIDLFVIAHNNLVWVTRLFLILVLIFMGNYRRKNDTNFKDKICLNLIIGNGNLEFAKSKQNLYLAHEIVQLYPIMQRNNTYKKFIIKNKWILDFLPNAFIRINKYKLFINSKTIKINNLIITLLLILKAEKLAKALQWNYMKNNVTKEEIKDDLLAFHPIDYKNKILKLYNKNLQNIRK